MFYIGHTAFLLEPKKIYTSSYSIIDYVQDNKLENSNWYHYILKCLINLEYALVRKEPVKAKNLLSSIHCLKIPDDFALEKIEINFISSLITYVQEMNICPLQKLFTYLEILDMTGLSKRFKRAFQRFVLYSL